MIRCWHVIALGLIALCCSASTPASSQAADAEAPPVYLYETEADTRLRHQTADLSDRMSRMEGRLNGIEEATTRAAAAGENAAKSSHDVITTIGTCTKFVTLAIAIVGGLLGFFGYRELKGVQAVRKEAEDLLKSAEGMSQETIELLASAKADAEEIAALKKQIEAADEIEVTGKVSREERETLEEASIAADRLEDLGQPLTPEAYLARANDYFYEEDYERALVEYDRAIRLQPDFPEAHHNRGWTLDELGRYEEAVAAYTRGIKLEPKEDVLYYNRACAYSGLNQRDEAMRDLKRAIELDETLRELARTDEDFESLHADLEFKELVGLEEEEPSS
jgi:tetratricopeptide (TPR) repeat protein